MGLDGDVCGGHQLMDRALVGYAVQFLALGIGEHTFERQFDVQCIFAELLFTGVVFDLDRDACQRDVFLLRVEL